MPSTKTVLFWVGVRIPGLSYLVSSRYMGAVVLAARERRDMLKAFGAEIMMSKRSCKHACKNTKFRMCGDGDGGML